MCQFHDGIYGSYNCAWHRLTVLSLAILRHIENNFQKQIWICCYLIYKVVWRVLASCPQSYLRRWFLRPWSILFNFFSNFNVKKVTGSFNNAFPSNSDWKLIKYLSYLFIINLVKVIKKFRHFFFTPILPGLLLLSSLSLESQKH